MALCSDSRQQTGDLGASLGNSAASLQKSGSKWFQQWVPHDTVLNSGKLSLLKWVNDDMLKSMKEKSVEIEEEIEEEEYEVLYLCTFEGCGKAFTEQGSLRKHMNVHGEKQFICHYEGCGKRFMDSSKLKRHFLIHTGERHFVCPVDGCGKAFSLDFNLRSHMRTHTQENYHVCPFEDCRKRYAHEYKLRAHLRTYHEKVLPPDVKLAPPAPLPASLEKEIRNQKSAAAAAAAAASAVAVAAASAAASTNHERPFACHHKGCDKRYIHEYKLNLHLRKEHANETPVEARQPQWYGDREDDVDESRVHRDQTKARGTGREKAPILKVPTPKATKRKFPNQVSVDVSRKMSGSRNAPSRSAMMKPDPRIVRQNRQVVKRQLPGESETDDEEGQEDMENENIGRRINVRTPFEDDYETEDDMD